MHPTASDLCSRCNMLLKYVRYLLQEHQVLIGVTACERREQHLHTARLWHICRMRETRTCPATFRRSGRRNTESYLHLFCLSCLCAIFGQREDSTSAVSGCAAVTLAWRARRHPATPVHVRHLIVPQPSLSDCSFAFV